MRFRQLFIAVVAMLAMGARAQSPKYEMRAAWLATIGGIDWPRTYDQQMQRQQLCDMLDRLKGAGINAVFIQARIRATTIYPSAFEPFDACITGASGRRPNYDPLQEAVEQCHKRGMQCHAWVVTIPVGKWNKAGCQQLRKKHPRLIKRIGDEAYMDPEQPQTAVYLADICREIVRNYDVDGIHLDYIRYPETWKLKTNRAKARQNITDIVQTISRSVKAEKPWAMLSCAPIGKHDDLTRYSSRGWNARTTVCQDAQAWMRDGIVDALLPMMYFQDNNFFPFAIDWKEKAYGRIVAPGLGIYFLDPHEGRWTLSQVERQMHVLRQLGLGHCFFRAKYLTDNVKGIYDFVSRFDDTPALVPPMTWAGQPAPTAPTALWVEGNTLSWSGATNPSHSSYLLYNLYASEDYPVDIRMTENLVATRLTTTSVMVPNSRKNYAVTAVDRYGQESAPAQLLLNAGPHYSAPVISCTDGRPVALPHDSLLDAEYVIVETLLGQRISLHRFSPTLSVEHLPDGIYQLRSLGRKGRNHRIGFFMVKRNQ